MLSWVDDLAGALKDIFHYVAYFLVGTILVGTPLYGIAVLFNWLL